MSASLRPAAPAGARQPATDPGQAAAEQRPATQGRHAHPHQDGEGRVAPAGGMEQPSSRPSASERRAVGQGRSCRMSPDGPSEPGERETPERLSGPVLPGCREWPGSRPGRRRAAAGLVAVCVLALGVAACSVKDTKTEASASASASASAAVARAEKGIANASATASREAALTPELRAKRDTALAEPAPEKPEQMNDQTREGATLTAWYFLELYRYAYMTGNTTELAAMSDDRCQFCQSVIDRATKLHQNGGWADKWDQEITNYTYYEKIEGYDYNELDVTANQGEIVSHPGGGKAPTISESKHNQVLDFAIRHNGNRWMVGGVEVLNK